MNESEETSVVLETPTKSTPGSGRKSKGKGSRISELQKRFTTTTGESTPVDMDKVATPMTRSATQKKIDEHNVKVWLHQNVITSRDF